MKTNTLNFISSSLILLLSLTSSFADTFGDLGQELKITDRFVDKTLDKTSNVLEDQQRILFTNLQFYTEYLLGRFKGQLNDLTKELNKSQRRILSEVRIINKTIESSTMSLEEKIEDVAISIENSLTRLPFAKRTPTPLWYDVPIITTTQRDEIKIHIKGVRLGNPRNHIIFNGKKFPRAHNPTDRDNIFIVSLTNDDVFDPSKKDHEFKVVLYKRKKAYTYEMPFVVVPQKIAKVSFVYDLPYTAHKRKGPYRGTKSATSGTNKTVSKTETFRLVNRAELQWYMDRPSINCRKKKGKGKKHEYFGPKNITDVSFQAGAKAKKGRAVCECTWYEKLNVEKHKEGKKTVYLSFEDRNHAGDLPKNAEFKRVLYEFYDGHEEEAFTSPAGKKYNIEYSLEGRSYTVKFDN